jgi:hypothetical protein
MAIAERRAAREGKTLDQIFAEDRAALRASTYPGPECLQPYEVEDYLDGKLPPNRASHLTTCETCDGLIRALQPTEKDIEDLVGAAAAAARMRAAETTSSERVERRARASTRRRYVSWGSLSDAVAASIIPLITVLAVALWGNLDRTSIAAATLTAAIQHSFGAFAVALLVAWSLAAAVPLAINVRSPLIRRSGGALIAGLAVVVLLWGNIGEQTAAVETARTLSELQVAAVVSQALEEQRAEGTFPVKTVTEGPVSVTTETSSGDRAVYRGTAAGVPGEIVATVEPGEGVLTWDKGPPPDVSRVVLTSVRSQRGVRVVVVDGKTIDVGSWVDSDDVRDGDRVVVWARRGREGDESFMVRAAAAR